MTELKRNNATKGMADITISQEALGPAIENIILGVLANGLTSIFSNIGQKCKNEAINKKINEEKDTIQTILANAVVAISDNEELRQRSDVNNISSFLSSPEIETIVRQIFSSRLLKIDYSEDIYKEFVSHFAHFTGIEQGSIENPARHLFDAMILGCDQALEVAVDEGILSAHEARSSFRHQVLLDELTSIQKILDFFYIREKPGLQDILDFEKNYRQQIVIRHGTITPPNFDRAYKIPINDLYVPPNFLKMSRSKNDESNILDIDEFLSLIHRTVLIGTPGGGKSTLSHKICNDLAANSLGRLLAGRRITPVLVVLRDYGNEKKAHSCSILEFIENNANSKYQVKPPKDAIQYLLLNGHIAVIFDGLDELLDTSYRQEISSDIESFCALYPSVPVLVTSREVGYEQAPLNETQFEVFSLSPFNDIQVKKYVTNWFSTDRELTHDQQTQRAEAFLEESEIVPDLRSNPLMLALMCNIYLGENYIPNNRPDVYEKCANMLFDRWDKGRGIRVPSSVEVIQAHIRPTMMYLASWIYSNEALQGGVTERNLIIKAAEYLNEKRFEDIDEAENAAKRFIDFCRGRAWVFTDIGTTKDGVNLYQFTHRTFLEYFTAAHLVRINPTPEKLRETLFPKIAKREWDVVAQLGFQIQNRNVEGAADELLTALVENSLKAKIDEKWNFLSFAARCLEFIIPKPKTVRLIASEFIDSWLKFGLKILNKPKDEFYRIFEDRPEEILGILLNCATENQKTLFDTLVAELIERINKGNEMEDRLILEVTVNLGTSPRQLIREKKTYHEILDICKIIHKRVLEECSTKVNQLCAKYWYLCRMITWQGFVSIDDFLSWHGFNRLFDTVSMVMFPRKIFASYAQSLFYVVMQYRVRQESEDLLRMHLYDLHKIGAILTNTSTPWIGTSRANRSHFQIHTNYFLKDIFIRRPRKIRTLPYDFINDPYALFGAFALVGIALEMTDREENEIIKNNLSIPFMKYIKIVLLARIDENGSVNTMNELSKLNFTNEQRDLILKWMQKKITFVNLF